MSVDVRINGADYPDVPAIDVPKTNNGGTATFYDCSGDTATAADVISGKTCHTASGLITGTASAGVDLGAFMTNQPETYTIACPANSTFYGRLLVNYLTLTGCTIIDGFSYNNSVYSLNAPDATKIEIGGLSHMAWLEAVSLPKVEIVSSSAFYGTWRLASITLPSCTDIWNSAFYGCDALADVYLPGNTVVAIDPDVFDNTPIASGSGTVHVPAALETTYKAATNWVRYASAIVGDL